MTSVPPVSASEAHSDISSAVSGIRAPLHLCPLTSTGIAKARLALPLISAYSITPDKLESAPTRHTAKSRPGLCAERGGGRSPGAGPVPSRRAALYDTAKHPALPRPAFANLCSSADRAPGLPGLPRAGGRTAGGSRLVPVGLGAAERTVCTGCAPAGSAACPATVCPRAPSGGTDGGSAAALGAPPPSPPPPPRPTLPPDSGPRAF